MPTRGVLPPLWPLGGAGGTNLPPVLGAEDEEEEDEGVAVELQRWETKGSARWTTPALAAGSSAAERNNALAGGDIVVYVTMVFWYQCEAGVAERAL